MSQRGRIIRRVLSALLALTLGLIPAGTGHAQDLKLNDLVEKAKELDGREVTVTGEALGDVMFRGDYGWVNIGDGTNTIGIWAPAAFLRRISRTGRYGWKGDTVRVIGAFFRMDPQNGGDLDIQARTLEVIEPGVPAAHPVDPSRIVWAVTMTVAGASAAGLWRRRRNLSRCAKAD